MAAIDATWLPLILIVQTPKKLTPWLRPYVEAYVAVANRVKEVEALKTPASAFNPVDGIVFLSERDSITVHVSTRAECFGLKPWPGKEKNGERTAVRK